MGIHILVTFSSYTFIAVGKFKYPHTQDTYIKPILVIKITMFILSYTTQGRTLGFFHFYLALYMQLCFSRKGSQYLTQVTVFMHNDRFIWITISKMTGLCCTGVHGYLLPGSVSQAIKLAAAVICTLLEIEVMTNTIPICCFLQVQCPYQQIFSFSKFLRDYCFPATKSVHCSPAHVWQKFMEPCIT